MERVFSDHSEPVKRELRAYIEDWGKSSMKKNYQRNRTPFLAKYGGLSLYDIYFEKRYSIDDEIIHFVNGDVYDLIGNPDHPYGTSSDHEYFCIHDDLFDGILENDQNSDIILKVIHKEPSLSSINDNRSYSTSKNNSRSKMVPPCHQLQRKRQKIINIPIIQSIISS